MPRDVIADVLAVVFAVAAVQKLRRPRAGAGALATYSVAPALRLPALIAVVALELGLAAGLALGRPEAAWAGAALAVGFAALAARGLRAGHAGAPCACFGPGSRLSSFSLIRNLALAAALVVTPLLPDATLATTTWLAIGLVLALAGLVALAVTVAALAREVGVLRGELVPTPALEIPHEGPELGERSSLIERFRLDPPATWALAVFTSEGCHLCQVLAPSIAALAHDPLVALEVFDEHRDALTWRALGIPGSPFAVAMDAAGRVHAKGTFNSPAQLEGVLATAERRRLSPVHPQAADG